MLYMRFQYDWEMVLIQRILISSEAILVKLIKRRFYGGTIAEPYYGYLSKKENISLYYSKFMILFFYLWKVVCNTMLNTIFGWELVLIQQFQCYTIAEPYYFYLSKKENISLYSSNFSLLKLSLACKKD